MKVIRSQRAGFCMGVALALRKLDALLEKVEMADKIETADKVEIAGKVETADKVEKIEKGGLVGTYGPIIHNPYVLNQYKNKGVECFENIESVSNVSSQNNSELNILLRAHGVPRQVESTLANLAHVKLMDATCPRVKDAQNAIANATAGENPKILLLFGDAHHAEVEGLVSYACGKFIVSSEPQELIDFVRNHQDFPMVLAAQTTQDRHVFDKLCEDLGSSVEILNTICDATRLRQEEALEVAKQVQAMVIVGGKNSGNSKRLAEIVSSENIPTIFVETVAEIDVNVFRGMEVVGITAGASTPKVLVDEIESLLSELNPQAV